ncbi:hypothetical protein [Demequina globuliformis]|uniref:hypothetical protein n=1 Tax=Demequina globuliformis TaxID=676202 RepID=UPI000782FA77|nr:hypothetical protein [Demequina globuliformis]
MTTIDDIRELWINHSDPMALLTNEAMHAEFDAAIQRDLAHAVALERNAVIAHLNAKANRYRDDAQGTDDSDEERSAAWVAHDALRAAALDIGDGAHNEQEVDQ